MTGTDRIGIGKLSPATDFFLSADVISQNVAGNYSVVRGYIRAVNRGNSSSQFLNGGRHYGQINGHGVFGDRNVGSGFLPGGSGTNAVRYELGADVVVYHASNGTATITLQMGLVYGSINETHTAVMSLPSIPREPGPTTPIGIDEVTSTSLRYRFNGAATGAPATGQQIQYADNAAFTGAVTEASSGTSILTGLTSGKTYYVRSRTINSIGNGPWSAASSAYLPLPAPTFSSWSQNSSGGLVAAWTAPSATTGLTGYRLQLAHDAGFTTGVQNIDLGNVLTHTVTGLVGGRAYYARVAARSAGTNTWSVSRNVTLVLAAGDLDGWTRVGTKPANISYFTTEGLRRGVVGTAQALILESLATGSVSLAADTFGIQRIISGLTVGKAYRYQARATLTGAALGDSYRLRVISESSASPVTVTTDTDLGFIEFVADSTSVTLQLLLADDVSVPGATDVVERVAFHTIKLLELDTDFPQRLRGTVYESNLANHFDLACNSVGATWYVGKDGVTRFRLPGSALPISAVFSDEVNPAAVSYVDITAGYDTRTTVNRIEATNYGVGEDGNEENDELIVEDTASQLAYGVYRATLALNLYDEAPYDDSFVERLQALLEAYKTPVARVSALRWNAQEDLALAAALDVGQRIRVRYRGSDYDSQIVNLQHAITPTRWMVTLTLMSI